MPSPLLEAPAPSPPDLGAALPSAPASPADLPDCVLCHVLVSVVPLLTLPSVLRTLGQGPFLLSALSCPQQWSDAWLTVGACEAS